MPPESNDSDFILSRLIHKANPTQPAQTRIMQLDSKDIIFGGFVNAM